MLITVNKTVPEMIEVDLSTPIYMKYGDCMFYRFTENERVLMFDFVRGFSLNERDMKNGYEEPLLNKESKYTEITGEEFYTALNEQLKKLNLCLPQ